ncbi:MAG: hypothetical protein Q8K51_13725 [Nitrospirota bacterium]|nr:hypothetical protein [Nitrospirota bacterium]
MGTIATFTAELLGDGHLPIPEKVIKALSLKKGEKVKAVIEAEKFDKAGFLSLSGIWKDKAEEELGIYKNILEDRENFGRREVKI